MIWEQVESKEDYSMATGFYRATSREFMHRGFNISAGFGDIFAVPYRMLPTAFSTPVNQDANIRGLFAYVFKSFPGEEHLRGESSRTLWGPIMNGGVRTRDELNSFAGKSRIQITTKMHQYLEKRVALPWAVFTSEFWPRL